MIRVVENERMESRIMLVPIEGLTILDILHINIVICVVAESVS